MSDEPSDAKKLIAQTMRAHRSYYNHGDQYDRCTGCNWKGCGPDEHEAHLAAEVDKALGGLTRESDTCRDGVGNVVRVWDRWTSGWTVTE
ncbi:hypothetical protein [Mycobacteroides abscessus]|uniref:hypothetical protein n=1 Tax=Mycobacteroides abscessus TaxID=36809 RepID=UPI001F42F097|nr:hypothetical protein [Mycobacteroides abscessus]